MHIVLMKKVVDLDASPVLYENSFATKGCLEEWDRRSGEWSEDDGWVTGRHPDNSPGMIVCRKPFPGDVIVDFEARTVPPSTHDINFMWNGSWDEAKNERGVAYVAGLQGWWEGKVGIEKSPDYKLNAGTPLFPFEPGHTYHIQGGSIGGHCFVCVDGKLLLEVTDPEPIDSSVHTRVGFEAYASQIQVRNVKIRQAAWKATAPRYEPE
jgi:hypothetical protein